MSRTLPTYEGSFSCPYKEYPAGLLTTLQPEIERGKQKTWAIVVSIPADGKQRWPTIFVYLQMNGI